METNVQEQPKPSLLQMFKEPKQQFERIKERPIYGFALLVSIVLTLIGIYLSLLHVDLSAILTDELDLEGLSNHFHRVNFTIGGTIGAVISLLFISVIHLLVAKIASLKVTFRKLFSMNIYIFFISAIGTLLNGVIAALFKLDKTFTSLGLFFSDEQSVTFVIVNHFELFTIWTIILTAFGLKTVGKFPKTLAWAIPIISFFIGMFSSLSELQLL